jgi:hypothetical protein
VSSTSEASGEITYAFLGFALPARVREAIALTREQRLMLQVGI